MSQLKFQLLLLMIPLFAGCHQMQEKNYGEHANPAVVSQPAFKESYEELKLRINDKRKKWASLSERWSDSLQNVITDFWVTAIARDLFQKWVTTPWDFNGHTTQPQQGTIACGYFVTTLLADMSLPIKRVKLATCPSSIMMKSLVPGQRLRNWSGIDDGDFNQRLKAWGKGVYIIGLDFHTGFIVNDGTGNWFIHSNYIGRKGVTREPVLSSAALRASKTRWLVSLTGDSSFLQRWLKG